MKRNPKQVSRFLFAYLMIYLTLAIVDDIVRIPYSSYVTQFFPIVLGVIYLLITRRNPIEELHLHYCSLFTFPLIVVYTLVLWPMVSMVNIASMLFTSNLITGTVTQTVSSHGLVYGLLTLALFPALVEEFVFRGILFGGWRMNRPLRAILLSALCFGLMHMNFNQMLYAMTLGIFLALAVEATGSLFASIFMHFTFNSISVCATYVNLTSTVEDATEAMNNTVTDKQQLIDTCIQLLPYAVVGLILAVLVLILMARINGRRTELRSLIRFGSKSQGESTRIRCGWLYAYMIICFIMCLITQHFSSAA